MLQLELQLQLVGEWCLHIDVFKLDLRTYVEGPSEELVPLNGPKSQVTTSSTTTDSVLGFVHIFLFHPYTCHMSCSGHEDPQWIFSIIYTCDRKKQMWISMVNFQNLKKWDFKPYFTIFHWDLTIFNQQFSCDFSWNLNEIHGISHPIITLGMVTMVTMVMALGLPVCHIRRWVGKLLVNFLIIPKPDFSESMCIFPMGNPPNMGNIIGIFGHFVLDSFSKSKFSIQTWDANGLSARCDDADEDPERKIGWRMW